MGKTTVVKKMRLETPVGMQAFYRDVENLETPAEFVERVFHDVEAVLGPRQRVAAKTRQLLQRLSGEELTGIVKFPATYLLEWDHYVRRRATDGLLAFRFPLIEQWWRMFRMT